MNMLLTLLLLTFVNLFPVWSVGPPLRQVHGMHTIVVVLKVIIVFGKGGRDRVLPGENTSSTWPCRRLRARPSQTGIRVSRACSHKRPTRRL